MLKRILNRVLGLAGYQITKARPKGRAPVQPRQFETYDAPAPEAPPGFDPETFFAQRDWWHHRWQLFRNVWIPGKGDVNLMLARLGLPRDLSGLRVLDVGAFTGCASFECERRGAEVLAIDIMPEEVTGFHLLKGALGSRVTHLRRSVYQLDPRELGTFDLILFCGVLYHLRWPMLGIDNLRRVSRPGMCLLIETHAHSLDPLEPPAWVFYPGAELNGDPSNWFSPNPAAVVTAFETLGYETEYVGASPGPRAYFRATLTRETPPFLEGSGEGLYYDLSVRPLLGDDLRR